MIAKNKNWMLISSGALVLSMLSVFFPIIKYTANYGGDIGKEYSFNILQLLDRRSFAEYVLSEYRGDFLYGMSMSAANVIIGLLCVVGIAAIVLSVVGLKSMSKQYESAWPFRLTLAGIVCTAIPAIVILVAVLMSGTAFIGEMQVGLYSYVTPTAMIISCITVTKRHRLTREELYIQKAASMYIKPAGDLPLQ